MRTLKVLKELPFAKVGDILEYSLINGLWVERKDIPSGWLKINIDLWIKKGYLEWIKKE